MAAGALALGAGAGQGLEDVLNRIMTEEKLRQLKDQFQQTHDESVRAHTAMEGIDREKIAAGERERISRDAILRQGHDDEQANKLRDDGRAAAEQIPGGTVMAADDPTTKILPQSLLRGLKAQTSTSLAPNVMGGESTISSDADMGTFKGQEIPATSRIKLKTFAQQEKSAADERAAEAEAEKQRHDIETENKPPAPDRVLIQTPEGYMPRSTARGIIEGGGQVAGPESAQTKNRRDMATAVGSHFEDANQLIDEADKRGLLGPIAGRTFTDFLAGHVGSTGNAENDALLGDLRTSLSMIRSGTASLHGRTGANVGIAKDIEKKMDEGHMSAAELKGSLSALKKWVDTYAAPKKATGSGGLSAEELIKKYGGD